MTIEVVHGDSYKLLRTLGARSVGCVITDPPYSDHTHDKQRVGCTGYSEPTRPGAVRAQIARAKDLGFDALSDNQRAELAMEFARVARRWILVFTDDRGIEGWHWAFDLANIEWVRTGVWVKQGATPQFTGDRPAQGVEFILIAHAPRAKGSGRMHWNGGGRHAIWTCPIVLNRSRAGEQRVHTAQKPLALMEMLVRDFTDRGESILDPFAGSGTTLVAAKRLGRKGLGYENKKKYVTLANKRIASTGEQGQLFE